MSHNNVSCPLTERAYARALSHISNTPPIASAWEPLRWAKRRSSRAVRKEANSFANRAKLELRALGHHTPNETPNAFAADDHACTTLPPYPAPCLTTTHKCISALRTLRHAESGRTASDSMSAIYYLHILVRTLYLENCIENI